MEENDYDYDQQRRGPNLPIYKVHSVGSLSSVVIPAVFWIVVIALLLSLFGCAGLEEMDSGEIAGVVATEIAEAAPIVASNPNMPGVLTAIASVVAGLAGAGLGAEAKKRSVKNKISGGALGKHAAENVESL